MSSANKLARRNHWRFKNRNRRVRLEHAPEDSVENQSSSRLSDVGRIELFVNPVVGVESPLILGHRPGGHNVFIRRGECTVYYKSAVVDEAGVVQRLEDSLGNRLCRHVDQMLALVLSVANADGRDVLPVALDYFVFFDVFEQSYSELLHFISNSRGDFVQFRPVRQFTLLVDITKIEDFF
jgi:hypothetical protein